ncbi:MAG: hypothetical protein AAGF15_05410 [Pseudomonadota bacterium]
MTDPADVTTASTRAWIAPALALFTSTGTLLCCALPALFVALGMGAVVAGVVTSVPGLIWLSAHKALVFGVAGALLVIAGGLQWRARNLPCPADPRLARACMRSRAIAKWVYVLAVLVYLVGAFFAFLAGSLLL